MAVSRIEAYRKAGKTPTSVALDVDVVADLDAIARDAGTNRNKVMADAIEEYVRSYPAVKAAQERAAVAERSWSRGDVETLKAVQGALSDEAFADQLGIAERTWREIKSGRAISFAVLFDALRRHPELLEGR